MKVAFRANGGGAGIGFGHLMRCIAIADAMKARGATAWFVSKNYPAGLELVKSRGYAVHALPHNVPLAEDLQLSLILMKDADLIVADSYEFDTNYLEGLKGSGKMVATIDDKVDKLLPVDIVIGNAYATRELYGAKLPDRVKLLAGPKYLPLRKEFENMTLHSIRPQVARVLITMGGEDPVNATLKVVEALGKYEHPIVLDVLIGAAYKHRESLEAALKNQPQKYAIHENLKNLVPLYKNTDAAITAPGVSLWEMAATGLPMAVVQTADNQSGVVQYTGKNNLGIVIGWHDKIMPEDIISGMHVLAERKMREGLSMRCQKLVDGRGAERIADALMIAMKERA
jgi:UDP-2,4-diacetamido-2,4,6-trideoxy-beta-L-altropyranose hydrolase